MAKLLFTVSFVLVFYTLVAVITLEPSSSLATLPSKEKPPERLNLHDSGVYKQLYDEINGHVLMLFSDSNQISRMLLVINDAWNLRPSLVGATTLNASITVFESPIRLPGAYDIEYVRIIGGGYMLKSVKSNL